MSAQEYYHTSVGHCIIWGETKDHPDMVIVSENGEYGSLYVVKRDELVKNEDTWEFQKAKERADELRLITAKAQENLDKLADKLVDKAIIALNSRMKFNAVFGKETNGATAGWVLTVVDELKKLIKEKAPDVIKGKDDNELDF